MSLPRLAYLTGEYPRATDTFIQREVAALRAEGFSIDTFAVRRPGPDHLTGPEQHRGQASTTYLLELARSPALPIAHVTAVLRRPGRYLRALALALRTGRPGIRGSVYQLIYFVEAVLLAQQLLKRRIDHLHNHFGDSSCTVAMLAAEAAGLPFSFTLHGSGIFFEAKSWRLDEKLARASFCACISHFTRSQAAIFAGAEHHDRLHLIHCGVEPHRLASVTHDGQGTRLIFVGRVVETKGLSDLFDAMGPLVERWPDLTLTVVGDGPDRAALAQQAQRSGLAQQVEFTGTKAQGDVTGLLAAADVFVLPSYAEGVPVVVMEALGAGVPVVATFVGGITELVEDDVTGYLVRPTDADHLADRIARLVEDPALRTRLGQAGRSKVEAEFDSRIEARRLATLFVNTAAGRSTPTRPPPLPTTPALDAPAQDART